MRSRLWVVLDCTMLLIVIALEAWRLTGVVLHEWLAVALIAGIVAHLLLHWSWVETRSRRILKPLTTRTRVNYALNAALFVAMTAALISGFAISKVVLPLRPTAEEYLRWHGIHDTSSRIAMIAAALHLSLNWDLLFAARPRIRAWLRPALVIMAAAVIIGGVLTAIERVSPRPDITLIEGSGRRIEHAAPPRDIANLRRDEIAPSKRGVPAFFVQSVFVAVVTVIGRKVLRLRID